MSDETKAVGGRLPLLKPDALDPAQRRLYDRIVEEQVPWANQSGFQAAAPGGSLLGPFNALLFRPEAGQANLDYFLADRKGTSLTPRVHEVVVLTVGAAWQSAYELYAHAAVARAAGLPEEAVQALAAGRLPAGLSEQENSAHEFTRQLVADHRVDGPTYARAAQAFGDMGVVDIVMLAGLYLMTCATLNAFEVPAPQ